MKILLLTICSFIVANAFGQDTLAVNWCKIINNPYSGDSYTGCITLDENGNIYTPVTSFHDPKWDYCEIRTYKFDSLGNELWSAPHIFAHNYNQYSNGIDYKDGVLYIAGSVATEPLSATYFDALIYALDSETHEEIWIWNWDGQNNRDQLYAIKVEDDGIYAVGRTHDSISSSDILITKLDFNGKEIWIKKWGTPNGDIPFGDIIINDSCIYITGVSSDQVFLASFNKKSGDYIWHTLRGESEPVIGNDIVSDTSFIYQSISTSYYYDSTAFLNKYDLKGNLLLTTFIDFADTEGLLNIEFSEDNSLYLGFNSKSLETKNNNFVIVKYNPLNGEQIESKIMETGVSGIYSFKILYNDIYLMGSSDGNAVLAKAPVFSSITGIQEKNYFDVNIFPNPTSDKFWISGSKLNEQTTLKIYNSAGKLIKIFTGVPNGQIEINSFNWNKGLYFVVIDKKIYKLLKI